MSIINSYEIKVEINDFGTLNIYIYITFSKIHINFKDIFVLKPKISYVMR